MAKTKKAAVRDVRSPKAWRLVDGALIAASGGGMRAGCHHTGVLKACGGCCARLYDAMDEVERALRTGKTADALSILEAVGVAMKAEAKTAESAS